MGDKVWLNMQELDEVNAGLVAAISEFEQVADSNDDAEEAVGKPDERPDLKDKMHDFEGAWNDKREKLKEGLAELQEHLQGIIDGWREFDAEAQRALSESGPDNQPIN